MHINIDRPTRGLAVDMRYDETISRLRLMDFASRGDGGHISNGPAARSSHYRYDGWLFPRAGLVYAWTLTAEAGVRRRSSTPDARRAPKAERAPGDARSKSDKALVYGSLRRSRLARCMPDSQQPPMVTTPLAIRFWQNT